VGVSRDCPYLWGTPYYLRKKLRTSNFVGTFIGLIETKAHENVGNSAVGVVRESQGVPKMFRAPICRAHCAVIFAIAQLSCRTSILTLKVDLDLCKVNSVKIWHIGLC